MQPARDEGLTAGWSQVAPRPERKAHGHGAGRPPGSVHSSRTTRVRRSDGRRRSPSQCSTAACASKSRGTLSVTATHAVHEASAARVRPTRTVAASVPTPAGRRTSSGGTRSHGSWPSLQSQSFSQSIGAKEIPQSPRASCTTAPLALRAPQHATPSRTWRRPAARPRQPWARREGCCSCLASLPTNQRPFSFRRQHRFTMATPPHPSTAGAIAAHGEPRGLLARDACSCCWLA